MRKTLIDEEKYDEIREAVVTNMIDTFVDELPIELYKEEFRKEAIELTKIEGSYERKEFISKSTFLTNIWEVFILDSFIHSAMEEKLIEENIIIEFDEDSQI